MACGPLLALPLSYIPSISLGKVSVDKITAGGYVMSAFWAVFLAVVLVFFKEPKTRCASFQTWPYISECIKDLPFV